jgi:hypothetical protein
MGERLWPRFEPSYTVTDLEQEPGAVEHTFRHSMSVRSDAAPWDWDDVDAVRSILLSAPMPWLSSTCEIALGGYDNDVLVISAERESVQEDLQIEDLAILRYELSQMMAAFELCEPSVNGHTSDGRVVAEALRIQFADRELDISPEVAVARAENDLRKSRQHSGRADDPRAGDRDQSAHEWSLSSLDELYRWCDDLFLPRASVPSDVISLYRHAEFDVWSSRRDVSPWLVYMFGGHPLRGVSFEDLLSPGADGCFLVGIAGHGINSYGLGVVAKGTGYGVAIQAGWGAAYRSPSDTALGAGLIASWNAALNRIEHGPAPEGDETLILFSNYRGILQVCRPSGGESLPSPTPDVPSFPGPKWAPQLVRAARLDEQLAALGPMDETGEALLDLLRGLAGLSPMGR